MNRREGERLIEVIRELMAETGSASVRVNPSPATVATASKPGKIEVSNGPAPQAKPLEEQVIEPDKAGKVHLSAELLEIVYRQFRNRLIDELRIDPVFVQLLAAQNEIEVLIEPRRIPLDGSTTKGRTARLVAAGWFKETRATGAVRRELARTGPDPGGGGTLSDILAAFVKDGLLVRDGDGYAAAPGVKVTEKYLEAK